MALFNDIYCQICDRFYTKEQWKKRFFSSRHIYKEVNGNWPAYFPKFKLTSDEGMTIEKAFWEMIYTTMDCIEKHDFLKRYFRISTRINNYLPVRRGLMI